MDTFIYRLRFVFAGLLIIAGLFCISLLVSSIGLQDPADDEPSYSMGIMDGPNVVASGMGAAADGLSHAVVVAQRSLNSTANGIVSGGAAGAGIAGRASWSVVCAAGHGIASVGHGVAFVGHSVGGGIGFTARTAASAIGYGIRLPVSIFGVMTDTPVLSAAVKPVDHTPVPVIDPDSPELAAALKALPAAETAAPASSAPATPPTPASAWPIHGAITTLFGVPELPYQAVHTGLDISDGQRPGVTPVKAFRAGKVINTIWGGGLGNHVIVDHGAGVTSVYGHLASIAVQVGQQVDTSTVLGYEGTTGVSTGTHLHFEIRVNGQAADPHQFIPGQP